MMAQCRICYCFALFLILNRYSTNVVAQLLYDIPTLTANLSTTWHIRDSRTASSPVRIDFSDGSSIRPILVQSLEGSGFNCGFYCNGNCTSYLFAIYIIARMMYYYSLPMDSVTLMQGSPQVIWSANRDHPVSYGAILNFTATGNVVLRDVGGSTVWETNTSGKSVVGMELTEDGNLVLFDTNNSVVWQSFDYPTDCLLEGQRLYQGQQLIPSVSSTNWTAQKDMFYLQVTDQSLVAYFGSNPPQAYYQSESFNKYTNNDRKYVRFVDGNLSFYVPSSKSGEPDDSIVIAQTSSTQYLKFMPNGHLKGIEWRPGGIPEVDLLTDKVYGECTYPFACGRNAICAITRQCSCPVSSTSPEINYFRAVNLSCSEITPLTCNATEDHDFIPLNNVSIYNHSPADRENVSMEACKHVCLKNCLCKAVVFYPYLDPSYGRCYLPSDLYSLVSVVEQDEYRNNGSTFIKVVIPPRPKGKSLPVAVVITSIIGGLLVVGFISFLIRKLRPKAQMEEEFIDAVPGMPTRFTYEELKTATDKFSKKLGQGGFGSVFEGTLEDESKIAVKCLDSLGQVNKSFIAEVESIGSIHHVNLVKLRGFCAWKSQRFLVYDFMSNGSLDKWIYHGVREQILEWNCRKKIILDIAKGLAYLHEECAQKIIHLDIKPQNILLDKYFNAKVSDFGLSKLIDRNQSQVMTTMRGTPVYMAPEWLSSVITEKVDVYSFGIVLLEILCGRKNFDRSQPEENRHLLGVFQKCWEQGTLLDIVDNHSVDMQTHGSEVVEMMKVASWCLQTNFTRRPLMSVVMKVLEGVMDVEANLDYNFTDPRLQNTVVEHEKDMTQLLASTLSGPR